MKKVYVNQIRERDWVEEVFLVRDKVVGTAKNGKPYLTLKLMDRGGEAEGRVWDRVEEFSARFERDDFIRVGARASVYLGKMQLVVQELERVPDSAIDPGDFLPVSSRPVAEMLADLRDRVASLGDPHLRALMEAFLADEEFLADYSRAPAAKAMHHVYLGGLLEHSLAVATLAEDISLRYPGLNRDLLVAGALLHDVGKISELRYARSFEYTDAGKLIGHIVIGVELVEEKLRGIPGFPVETAVLLKHLLLSHHGQYEYGSPKRPKTLEAVILNFIDDLDSKINGVRSHLERDPDNDSAWSQYHRQYDRYFYKGGNGAENLPDVPPAPVVAPAVQTPPPAQSPPPAQRSAALHGSPFNNALQEKLRGMTPNLFAASEEKSDG